MVSPVWQYCQISYPLILLLYWGLPIISLTLDLWNPVCNSALFFIKPVVKQEDIVKAIKIIQSNDGDIKGKHFALYENDDLRAIARLDQNQNNISQVRFVAVDTKYQKKGFGKLIIKAAENESQKNGNKKMILHSRDYSLDFYKKIGYKKIKKSYKLFNIIQHYLMEKTY